MAIIHRIRGVRLRLPRPKTFLGFIPLQMGTELISLTLLFNKLTSLYGLLAILTGFSLSATQLSAYLYNVTVLVLVVICIPHIRRETPLPNLVLAWLYGIDTVINAVYTVAFAINWYLTSGSAAAVAATASSTVASASATAVATTTAVATATTVATTALSTLSTATLAMRPRDDAQSVATAVSAATSAAASAATTALSATAATVSEGAVQAANSTVPAATSMAGAGWLGGHETAASLTLITVVTVVRVYFSLVVMAHTRQVLRRYADNVAEPATAAENENDDEDDDDEDEDDEDGKAARDNDEGDDNDLDNDIDDEEAGLKSGKRSSRGGRRRRRRDPFARPRHTATAGGVGTNPFASGSPAGDGWRGKVGRALVKVGRNYWLGRNPDDGWARDVSSRFRV